MTVTATQEKKRVLRVADRCDRCGAQAYAKAQFMNGEMFFCGHHFTEFEKSIRAAAITVDDEREFRNE